MGRTGGRSIVMVVTLAAACLGPWGCAVKAARSPLLVPDEVRAQLNTVGLPVARALPEVSLMTNGGRGWGAAKGAGYGFAAGALPGLQILGASGGCGGSVVCGVIPIFGLGVAVAGGALGALGGTVYGAVTADSESSLETARAELERALVELEIQRSIRGHVLREAGERGVLQLVAVGDREPVGGTDSVDYRTLANEGIDSVLEVSVSGIQFSDGRGIKPPVTLIMNASVRLIRTADGAELFADTFSYRGAAAYRPLEWAAEGGRVFREEVDRATRLMADDIVRVVFRPES